MTAKSAIGPKGLMLLDIDMMGVSCVAVSK